MAGLGGNRPGYIWFHHWFLLLFAMATNDSFAKHNQYSWYFCLRRCPLRNSGDYFSSVLESRVSSIGVLHCWRSWVRRKVVWPSGADMAGGSLLFNLFVALSTPYFLQPFVGLQPCSIQRACFDESPVAGLWFDCDHLLFYLGHFLPVF